MRIGLLLRLMALLCVALAAYQIADQDAVALDDASPGVCNQSEFLTTADTPSLGRIKGERALKAYIITDSDPCLAAARPDSCRLKAYLVAGDTVIVARMKGEWACIWFPSDKRPSAGWVKSAQVESLSNTETTPLPAWMGKWEYRDNEIRISAGKEKGSLEIGGDAIWDGGKDQNGDIIAHTGELEGEARPSGVSLILGEAKDLDTFAAACAARLVLLGENLVVQDNRNCGGLNVTFSGVYRK